MVQLVDFEVRLFGESSINPEQWKLGKYDEQMMNLDSVASMLINSSEEIRDGNGVVSLDLMDEK